MALGNSVILYSNSDKNHLTLSDLRHITIIDNKEMDGPSLYLIH